MQETDPEEPTADPSQDAVLAQAFLALVNHGLAQKRAVPAVKRKQAETLFEDAPDAPSDEEEYAMLVEAARLDPANPSVLQELKAFFELSLEEDLAATRGIVTLAERRLGKKAFKAYAGHFWGFLEARPYMSARAELSDLLVEAGRRDEAAAEWEALLELNTNDNQGFRYLLLPYYLEAGRLDNADALLARYPDEATLTLVFAWSRVLAALLRNDEARAVEALADARRQNGFIEAYLLGHRRVPKDRPERYQLGSREEAESYAAELVSAWSAHPGALKWLARQPKSRA